MLSFLMALIFPVKQELRGLALGGRWRLEVGGLRSMNIWNGFYLRRDTALQGSVGPVEMENSDCPLW